MSLDLELRRPVRLSMFLGSRRRRSEGGGGVDILDGLAIVGDSELGTGRFNAAERAAPPVTSPLSPIVLSDGQAAISDKAGFLYP